MSNKIKIAIDAMGGENSPKKIMDGIKISLKTNKSLIKVARFKRTNLVQFHYIVHSNSKLKLVLELEVA